MAKKSSIEKNNRRKRMVKNAAPRREKLKAIIADKTIPMEERFAATLKLAEMPRNSSATRIRNRCELTGRPRSVYRKNKLSRIALRELGSKGLRLGEESAAGQQWSRHFRVVDTEGNHGRPRRARRECGRRSSLHGVLKRSTHVTYRQEACDGSVGCFRGRRWTDRQDEGAE